MPQKDNFEIKLKRGSTRNVHNLLSSFGPIKETNITSMLGYIFRLKPELLTELFDIKQPITSITLELQSKSKIDRYDLLIENLESSYVIEVKLHQHDLKQISRYRENEKNVYILGGAFKTHLVNNSQQHKFKTWDDLVNTFRKFKSSDIFYRKITEDFITHLKEFGMIHEKIGDVYVRDLSGDSVEMYFSQHIYKFQTKYFENAKTGRYFAPYLTQSNHKGHKESVFSSLGTGISFISKVKLAFIAEEKEVQFILRKEKYGERDINTIYAKFKWRKTSRKDVSVLLLDAPMRLFQHPITKKDLWNGPTGAMPPMCVDFGDLVAAANGLFPLSTKNKKAA